MKTNNYMPTYTNPQMLSPEALHEAHLEMAKKYLKNKWETSFYKLTPPPYVPEDFESPENIEERQKFYAPYYCELTDEQFSRVEKLVKENGGTQLCDLQCNDEDLMKFFVVSGYSPESIDATPLQACSCMVCVMDAAGMTKTFPHNLLLTQDDYLKLMVIVMDHRDVTFNDLYKLDLDLFKKISEEITSVAKYSEKYKKQSYTIVFEGIEEEVRSLLGEEDEHADLYAEYSERIVTVFFSENKMSVRQINISATSVDKDNYEDYGRKFIIYNIDAKAVLHLLDVNSYHDALVVLKNHYDDITSFSKMKEFLDDNKIKYEYADIKCY